MNSQIILSEEMKNVPLLTLVPVEGDEQESD